ncbi:MAG: hypothetical protein QM704_22215 [Anaeromyxobacteraceae bacterium]
MRLLAALAATLALAGPARAQTMLDQEQRLIDIHSLLLDLPAVQAPGALAAGELSASVELVTIPTIDGTTGSKRQITASDRTPVFPRPRLALGLPLGDRLRAFLGGAYIPPVRINEVSTHDLSAEAGVALSAGWLRAGLRLHGILARSSSPVTDPATRDVLTTRMGGAEVSIGASLAAGPVLRVEPYASAGVVSLRGRFRVTSDGNVLTSRHTGPALAAGARLLVRGRLELAGEVNAYPGRLVHPALRAGWVF